MKPSPAPRPADGMTMDGMGTHTRLTRGQRRALTFAVLVVIAGMGMGFASSFATLYGAALAHHWTLPALLPLSVDSGIVAYVILDHLAVTLGSRSRWLHLAAWSLAAFTVWANAAVSPADGTQWRVIHAAMPALWVLGVEALRFMWRHLHAAPPKADSIPSGRWLASPLPTFLLWRRMRLLNVTSWQRMAALEDARLCIRDRIRAAHEADASLTVPDAVERVVRSGRLPAAIAAAVDLDLEFGGTSRAEAAAEAWTDARLTLRDQVSAALETRRRDIARSAVRDDSRDDSGSLSASVPGITTPATPDTTPKAAPKPRRVVPSKASDDELAELVLPLFDDGSEVTKYKVVKTVREAAGGKAGIGDKRAGDILELARRKRVVPIGERKRA
jgi:hypothetical protein